MKQLFIKTVAAIRRNLEKIDRCIYYKLLLSGMDKTIRTAANWEYYRRRYLDK